MSGRGHMNVSAAATERRADEARHSEAAALGIRHLRSGVVQVERVGAVFHVGRYAHRGTEDVSGDFTTAELEALRDCIDAVLPRTVGEVPAAAASTTETSPQAPASPPPDSGDPAWISKGTAMDRLDDAHHAAMDTTP